MLRRSNPHIVFVTHHHPWRGGGGGRLRERELLERLRDDFRITVVAVCKDAADLASQRGSPVPVIAVPAERSRWRDLPRSPAERRHRAPEAVVEVAGLIACGDVDLVHVEGHYLRRLLPALIGVPLVVAENNVESDLIAQRLGLTTGYAARAALRWAGAATRASEGRAWTRADTVVTVTERDRLMIERRRLPKRVVVVADGANHVRAPAGGDQRRGGVLEVLFVANWAYSPNLDAARWLLDAIGPRIVDAVPEATIHLAGADAPRWLDAAVAGRRWARLTSPFADVEPLLDDAAVVLCPLRVGGGVKVKVLDALRRGRPVVTTAIGAQGIEGAAGAALLVGEDADTLARHAILLLADPERHAAVAEATLAAAEALPRWDVCAASLGACWRRASLAGAPAVAEHKVAVLSR